MKINRHFKLEAGALDGVHRFVSDIVDAIALGERRTTTVTITRTGKFYDPRYGDFEITREMLLSMVRNFNNDVYGQKIFVDVAHNPSNGAAAEFKRLMVQGNKLRGEVEFTEYGIDAIEKKKMIYLSAEFVENFVDNETRKQHGPTLLGAALTPRPVIKHLDPVQLSEAALDGAPATYLDKKIIRQLNEEGIQAMDKLLKELREKLQKFNLAEAIVSQLIHTYKAVAGQLAEEAMQRTVLAEFVTQGEAIAKQLADDGNTGSVTLQFDASGLERILSEQSKNTNAGLTAEEVKKILAEHEAENRKTLAEQQQKLEANKKLFTDKIAAAEGLKSLSEEQMNIVNSAIDVISADLTEDQVTKLAENQIRVGDQLAVNNQLGNMGYGATGVIHQNEQHDIVSLQEEIKKSLKGTSQYSAGELKLLDEEKLPPFAKQILAVFDLQQAPRLLSERKMLAAGEVGTSDTNLPAGFQRTVIIEALSDFRVLNVIQTLTDPNAQATTQIPYETRDTSAIRNSGIVYEGQPIHRANVAQAMDIAYILPMKLGMLVSNEVMHFSRASYINWDAYGRNVTMNARILRELVVARICNELQRSADAYGAVAVTGEAFDAQLNGSNSLIKSVNFPIVRQHQQRDLQGTAVGSVENPIAIVLNGTALSEYDGSGEQSAGTYYQITNYNLGYIQLVDESGTAVTPTDTGTNTLGYSYATNVLKFDLDNGSVDIEKHLNGLLRAFGTQKTLLSQDRFVKANFSLMSETLNNTASNAAAFEAQSKRNGTSTNNDGDLEMIKAVPAFATNAPGVDLGDERAIIGLRNTLTYTISKPYMIGDTFEAVDSNGKAIGKKQAYGEEYGAIKVPTPIRKYLTSVIAYSVTGR